MRYPKFILLSLAGGLPWIAAWAILGRELGSSYHSVQRASLHYVEHRGLVVIVRRDPSTSCSAAGAGRRARPGEAA